MCKAVFFPFNGFAFCKFFELWLAFEHTTFWFVLNRMNFVLHFLFLSLSLFQHYVFNWRTPLLTVHSEFHSIYHCMHISIAHLQFRWNGHFWHSWEFVFSSLPAVVAAWWWWWCYDDDVPLQTDGWMSLRSE